jgi:hypothetical protein
VTGVDTGVSASAVRRGGPLPPAVVYFLSYPKAGRTWLRAMIGKALVDHYGMPEKQLLNTIALTQAAGLPATLFDHDGSAMLDGLRWDAMPADKSFYRDKRVLLMGRDIRDNLVSAYLQATRRINVFEGPISEFIRHDVYGVEKILAFYRIWWANRRIPAAFHFLRYEDLHRDPAGVLARVLAFIGADIPPTGIAAAVEFCSFENLRQAEAEDRFGTPVLRAGRGDDPESFKVRKGKVGNFGEYLSADDVAFIDAANASRGCEFTRPAVSDGVRAPGESPS